MADDVRALFTRWLDAANRGDWDAMADLVHPDFVEEMPQSGESIRGWKNMRAMLESYPGAEGSAPGSVEDADFVEAPERFAVTPAYTLVRVDGSGDLHVITARIRYPDGSWWRAVFHARLKDGKLWRTTSYYAPEFDPPAWRSQWVERVGERAAAGGGAT